MTGFCIRVEWLAGAALALACTPTHSAGPPPDEARAPDVHIAKPPPPRPSTSSPALPARKPKLKPEPKSETARGKRDARRCKPLPLQGPGLTSRGSHHYVQAKTPAGCARCKGDWGPHGLAGVVSCLCRTPDAGKPCESPHDCTAECVVGGQRGRDLARDCPRVGAELHGHCARHYTTFGCYGFVVERPTPAGPLRGVSYVCVD